MDLPGLARGSKTDAGNPIKRIRNKPMKQKISHWIPAAFCAFLSLTALFSFSSPDAGSWKPAFFSFLPLCFFFVGANTLTLQREIRDLRKQLRDLQEKEAG
jgi:hypothetical protein